MIDMGVPAIAHDSWLRENEYSWFCEAYASASKDRVVANILKRMAPEDAHTLLIGLMKHPARFETPSGADWLSKFCGHAALSPRTMTEQLKAMEAVSEWLYLQTVIIGNHTFIEHCGLINEHIKILRSTMAMGVDFNECDVHSGKTLAIAPHNVEYLNEKIGCIYTRKLVLSEQATDDLSIEAAADYFESALTRVRKALASQSDRGGAVDVRLAEKLAAAHFAATRAMSDDGEMIMEDDHDVDGSGNPKPVERNPDRCVMSDRGAVCS